MLMPSIFGENLFDDFFGDFPFYYDDRAMKDAEKKLYGHKANHVMKTDIKEMNNGYELIVDKKSADTINLCNHIGGFILSDIFCHHR